MITIAKVLIFKIDFDFFQTRRLFLRSKIASVRRFYFCSTQNKQDKKDQYSERKGECVKKRFCK